MSDITPQNIHKSHIISYDNLYRYHISDCTHITCQASQIWLDKSNAHHRSGLHRSYIRLCTFLCISGNTRITIRDLHISSMRINTYYSSGSTRIIYHGLQVSFFGIYTYYSLGSIRIIIGIYSYDLSRSTHVIDHNLPVSLIRLCTCLTWGCTRST